MVEPTNGVALPSALLAEHYASPVASHRAVDPSGTLCRGRGAGSSPQCPAGNDWSGSKCSAWNASQSGDTHRDSAEMVIMGNAKSR